MRTPDRRSGGEWRPVRFERASLAEHRAESGRALAGGGGKRAAAVGVLLRRDRRRSVEDHQRRRDLVPGDRRADSQLVGRCGRGLGVESRRRVHRHGRNRIARQHHAGRRRVQDPSTAAKPGSTSGSPIRRRSRAFASIRQIPTWSYVAALGHPFGANEERGVFRSRDGGATWKRILFRNNRAGAIDLAMDPHNPRVLFASIWDVYRTPWTLSSGGPASGLFKSTDGGDTWTEITRNSGLPKGVLGKINVSISGADSKRVYAHGGGGRWRTVSIERRRPIVDPGQRRPQYPAARVLFLADPGGPAEPRHRLRHERRVLSFQRRRQDLPVAPYAARRPSRSMDRCRTIRSA